MAAEGARAPQRRALPTLPDDTISSILLLLPPEDVLRCRAVCKAWLRLAIDRYLLVAHHLRQRPQPLLLCYRRAGEGAKPAHPPYCLEIEAVDLRTDQRRVVVRFVDAEYDGGLAYGVHDVLEVHASCDGLLLLSFLDAFFVCNPATRRYAPLPPLHAREIAGLYPHAASGEYRVLYHRDEGVERKYYVFTVGSPNQQQARSIERRAASTLSAAVDEAALGEGVERACTMPPVLLRGSLHWPPQGRQADNILVFDTAAESFRWISPPAAHDYMLLFEMEGKLAMSCCEQNGRRGARLWLMEDYENEAWVCRYRIEFPVAEIDRVGSDIPWAVAVVSQEGDMLVECLDVVLHNDNKGKLKSRLCADGCGLLFSRHMLKESLVPHAFLQMQQDGGAGGGLPFFFQGP